MVNRKGIPVHFYLDDEAYEILRNSAILSGAGTTTAYLRAIILSNDGRFDGRGRALEDLRTLTFSIEDSPLRRKLLAIIKQLEKFS